MKTTIKVLNLIALICWTGLCIGVATGVFEIDTFDYCLVAGLLAFESLFNIITSN